MKRTPEMIAYDAANVYDATSDVLDRALIARERFVPDDAAHDLFKLATIAAGAAAESLRRSLIDANIHSSRSATAAFSIGTGRWMKSGIGYYYNKREGLVRIAPRARPEDRPKAAEGGDS